MKKSLLVIMILFVLSGQCLAAPSRPGDQECNSPFGAGFLLDTCKMDELRESFSQFRTRYVYLDLSEGLIDEAFTIHFYQVLKSLALGDQEVGRLWHKYEFPEKRAILLYHMATMAYISRGIFYDYSMHLVHLREFLDKDWPKLSTPGVQRYLWDCYAGSTNLGDFFKRFLADILVRAKKLGLDIKVDFFPQGPPYKNPPAGAYAEVLNRAQQAVQHYWRHGQKVARGMYVQSVVSSTANNMHYLRWNLFSLWIYERLLWEKLLPLATATQGGGNFRQIDTCLRRPYLAYAGYILEVLWYYGAVFSEFTPEVPELYPQLTEDDIQILRQLGQANAQAAAIAQSRVNKLLRKLSFPR